MIDRTPTEVLANGAVRYGIYDAAGTLLRYEHIKPEDAPTQEGTPLNKANLLKDATAALYGLTSSAVPDDVLAALSPLTKITSGTYVGTGTYGTANKNSLTFTFAPKLLLISAQGAGISSVASYSVLFALPKPGGGEADLNFIGLPGSTSTFIGYYASADGKTITFYSTSNAGAQMNISGQTYRYLAIQGG